MGTKSRDRIYGSSVRASAERAVAARQEADKLACEAWNKRMLGLRGPAQPIERRRGQLLLSFLFAVTPNRTMSL